MYCHPAFETIHVSLDGADRVTNYWLGESPSSEPGVETAPLLACVIGKTPRELLDDVLIHTHVLPKDAWALRAALGAFVGQPTGGEDDPCLAASITCDGNTVHIRAQLRQYESDANPAAEPGRACATGCPACPMRPQETEMIQGENGCECLG